MATIDSSDIRQKSSEGPGGWNAAGEPDILTYSVSGALAARVRRRFGVAEDVKVFLKHATYYGGYSEYTQENSVEFAVLAGDESIVFDPRESFWSATEVTSSVYGRFDAWLRATEDPVTLLSEWLSISPTEASETGQLTRHEFVQTSVLWPQLLGASQSRINHGYVSLYTSGDTTEVTVFGYGGKEGEFRPQYLRKDLGSLPAAGDMVALAPQVAKLLTDAFMVGNPGGY